MRVYPYCLLLLTFFTLKTSAQKNIPIKGITVDTAALVKLQNSTISVLNSKDSTLVRFTRTVSDGSFGLSGLTPGNYILLVTYPNYADFVEHFKLDSTETIRDFGRINMTLKSKLLSEVIIKGAVSAIKIKGDTTEYNASSFKIEPGAKVEELLRQLPGIQVDKDGKITAQGETVSKVLVDGEEFFGDDPTLVTKNLRGDMIDKVQLYDKKSDQATFTGIDDGEKTKTINLKLKENAKNGYFGKLDGGSLADTYYQGQGMFNAFKSKRKFSAYSTLGNTGKTGLGWEDNNKYGSGAKMEFNDDGGMMFYGGGGNDEFDSYDGQYNGEGLPLAQTGGLHYDTKWSNDRHSLNTNYKIGSIGVEGTRNSLSQNNLPTLNQTLNNSSDQRFEKLLFRQKIDANYQVKIDSTSNLKITFDGTLKNSENRDSSEGRSLANNIALINSNRNNLTNNVEQTLVNASALWNKRMKKKGRTFSLNIAQAYNESSSDGLLNSTIEVYNEGELRETQLIDQNRVNRGASNRLNSNIVYTEPVTKTLSLIVNYGLGINNSFADRKTFNKSALGEYTELNTDFSNDFRLNQTSNQAGSVFNYKKNKTNLSFGTKINAVSFNQKDRLLNREFNRRFVNWLPQANYQYKFSNQRSFRVSYNGNNNQPSLDQIQPMRVNNNPLFQNIGNEDLRPSFSNRFNVNYNSYKVISQQYISVNGFYSFTSNPIVSNSTIDGNGISTFQSINLKRKNSLNYNANAYFYTKLKKYDLNLGLNMSTYGNIYYNFLNNELNQTQSGNYAAGFNLSKYKQKKYSFDISFNPSYSTNQASLQKELNNNGWVYNSNASATIHLPKKLEISTEGRYEFREKTATFNENFERIIWNSSLTKRFFKEENLKLTLSGNDLLNQNIGFNRSAYNTTIYQSDHTTIKRYFLMSLAWDFNKMGAKTQK